MVYKKEENKESTIRVKNSTKERLIRLSFAKKNTSFDDIINEILNRLNKKRK